MGKIRVKTLGSEEEEKKQKAEAKKRRETKKLAKGVHGGERMVSMSPTEEEVEKEVEQVGKVEKVAQEEVAKVSKTTKQPRKRSKRYQDAMVKIDRNKRYTLADAVLLLKDIAAPPPAGRFDSTVELHVNTIEKGLLGQVTLPHGSGKSIRVAIANPQDEKGFEKLLQEVEGGTINFDVLIAHPTAMARLAKVAKILGPKGLMPNPKSGTISDKPEELAKKFAGGQTNFRTEAQAPIIHSVVGKVSFAPKDLEENVEEFLKAIGKSKITSVTLKSTMSPGIKIDFASLS